MTYTLHYEHHQLHLDKYCLKNSSMAGEKIQLLLDTEEELAYYAFKNNFYKTGFLSTVCSYNDLYTPQGKNITDKELNNIIRKHLPEETQKIDNRKKLCDNKFVSMVMNFNGWKMLTYWINYHNELIEKMPEDKKQKFMNVENKSQEYINTLESILNKKEQEQKLAEQAAIEVVENNWKKHKKI